MDWPISRTSPELGSSTPEIMLKKVLLPAPLGPIKACTSPAFTSIDTALFATSPPKRFVTCADSSSTWPFGGRLRRARAAGSFTVAGLSALRKRRDSRATEGHRPSAKRCSTKSIKRPNTITSKLPLCPSSLGRMSCSCDFSSVMSAAPSTAPHRWPAPPTTAMKRNSMPILRLKGVGLMKRCRWA
jgi:hypothetical protein